MPSWDGRIAINPGGRRRPSPPSAVHHNPATPAIRTRPWAQRTQTEERLLFQFPAEPKQELLTRITQGQAGRARRRSAQLRAPIANTAGSTKPKQAGNFIDLKVIAHYHTLRIATVVNANCRLCSRLVLNRKWHYL